MRSGILVVDKPSGMTSHDVVAITRRARKTREVGHAGTLDPMATGVLVVMIGEATKLAPYLTAADKEYVCEVALGKATDSLDADGQVTEELAPPADWVARLPQAIAIELARTAQTPPSVSAVHVDGERAHDRVRRGEAVVLPPREVAVRSIEVVAVRDASVELRVVASKGYYVRALARDLAASLGTVGHLVMLRRLRSGAFDLSTACAREHIAEATLLSVADAATRSLPAVTLTADGEARARVGKVVVDADRSPAVDGVQAWLAPSGALVAIAEVAAGEGRVRRGFTTDP